MVVNPAQHVWLGNAAIVATIGLLGTAWLGAPLLWLFLGALVLALSGLWQGWRHRSQRARTVRNPPDAATDRRADVVRLGDPALPLLRLDGAAGVQLQIRGGTLTATIASEQRTLSAAIDHSRIVALCCRYSRPPTSLPLAEIATDIAQCAPELPWLAQGYAQSLLPDGWMLQLTDCPPQCIRALRDGWAEGRFMDPEAAVGAGYDRRLQQAVADYLGRRGRFWDEEIIADLADRRQLGLHDLRAALRAAGVTPTSSRGR